MPVRIVVFENDRTIVKDLTNRLEILEYDVIGVFNTENEGIQHIKELNPDLLIMNTHLQKGIDGIKSGELIQSTHDVPIIFLVDPAGQTIIKNTKITSPFGYIFIPFTDAQIYTAIETALLRSHYEMKKQLQATRAQTLVMSAKQLNSNLDFESVLKKICDLTHHTLKASATGVYLFNNKEDIYQQVATISELDSLQYSKDVFSEIPASAVNSIVSFQNNVIFISNVTELNKFQYRQLLQGEKIQSMVIAGIFRQQTSLGIIVSMFIEPGKLLHSADMEMMIALADQAAIAITNASLLKQVQIGRDYQRELAKNLVDVQEEERRHLARELHDHLGQILTGLQFMLESTKNKSGVQQKISIEEIQKTIGELIEQVREMSLNLRPSMLDDMGLLPTIQWHVERFESQTDIRVNFYSSNCEKRFSSEIETTAYRIVQEALTNTARHAQVKEVFVGLLIHDDTLWVEVLDQGKGFDTEAVLKKSTSGLSGMQERASLVGGYLVIESYPNQGTQIVGALPLNKEYLERRKFDRYNSLAGR